MDVVSLCPLRVASLVWQPRRGTWVLTAVAKATYTLEPSESTLAHEQEYPNEDDNHWNDDAARSLYSPSDLVPFKPRADVMLVGHAFAPRKEPARSVVARLLVGEINKAIEVFGERSWAQDGSLREGPRFVKMPLRYERASGGPDTVNPVGMRLDARPDAYGSVAVPNLQPPGLSLADPKDFIEPIGFGPIASSWKARRDRLGRHAAVWSAAWSQQPIPEDIDPGYFNAAPRDQQIEALRPNERLILENLHPDHPRLSTNLPGVQPRAFVERRGGAAPQELAMICDTLWIDTDRGICTLTWRAQIPIEHPGQPGRVLVAMAEPGQRLTWSDVERLAVAAANEDTSTDTPTPRPPERADTGSVPAERRGKAHTLPFLQQPDLAALLAGAQGGEPPKVRATRPGVDSLTGTRDEEATATTTPLPKSAGGLPFGSAPPMAPPGLPAIVASSKPPGRRNNTTLDAGALNSAAPAWLAQVRAGGSPPSPQGAPPPGSPFSGVMPAPVVPPPGSPFAGASTTGSFQVPSPPFPALAAPSFGAPPPMAPPPMAPPPMAPPPMAPPPVVPPQGAPPSSDSPWAGAAARTVEPPSAPPLGIGATGLGAAVGLGSLGGLPVTGPGGAPVNLGPIPTSSSAPPSAPPLVNTASAASSGGVTAASNAAAANARVAATAPPSSPPQSAPMSSPRSSGRPREVVDLLWFDPAALPRMRARPDWKKLLEALRPRDPPKKKTKEALGFDDDEEEEVVEEVRPPDPPEVINRRDVIAILARGDAGEADGLADAIADAVDEDGSFTPPLVLIGGELLFPFDELEALKATTTVVTPLAGADKKLKEAVDAVNELLKTPALESSTGVAESQTTRLREAFAQSNRMLPANYLEAQTERMLLEQRHYQKRTVFGAPWVRSLIGAAGGSAQNAVPAYLPEPLGKQLPMFQRFRAKIIAEAHLQQDQYETSPTALKVVAVARVMPLGGVGRSSDKGKA